MTLLSTVVHTLQPNTVTIDAGLKALYQDGPGPKVHIEIWNLFVYIVFQVIHPPMKCNYTWCGDEHGLLHIDDPSEKPKLGSVVELLVSHCDPTINLHDHFFVVKDDTVIDVWEIEGRGCCQ